MSDYTFFPNDCCDCRRKTASSYYTQSFQCPSCQEKLFARLRGKYGRYKVRKKQAEPELSIKHKIGTKRGPRVNKYNKGENHGMSRLSSVEVINIYKLAHSGKLKLREIAEAFGVSVPTISEIKTGSKWAHVTSELKVSE